MQLFGAADGFVVLVSGTAEHTRDAAMDIASTLATWPGVASVVGPHPDLEIPGTVTADGAHAAVYVEITPEASDGASTRRLVERFPSLEVPKGIQVRAAGSILEEVEIARVLEHDLLRVVPLVLLGLVLCAWVVLRTLGAAFAVLIVLGTTLLLTLGTATVLHGTLTTITNLAIPFVTTVAAANAVHLTFRFRRDREMFPLDVALRRTIARGGRATALAALTTGAGFLALIVMRVPDFDRLAVLGAIGCVWVWAVVVGLLPALLARFDHARGGSPRVFGRRLVGLARGDLRRRGWGTALVVVLLVLLSAGAFRLTSQTRARDQIPSTSDFHEVADILDQQMGGTVALEVLFDADEDLRTEVGVARIRQVVAALQAGIQQASRIVSAADVVDLTQRVMPQASPATILAAQAAGALGPTPRYLDDSGRTARITVRLPTRSTRDILARLDEAESTLAAVVRTGESAQVVGVAAQLASSIEAAVTGQAVACLLSIAFISLVASLALRTWRVLPVIWSANLLPLLALGGVLGWFGEPISLSTATVGSIVFGLIVDDTLHLLYALREEGGGPRASARALDRLGPAFVSTSLVLLAGSILASLGQIPAVVVFGRLLAVGVILALLCDLFVAPRVAQALARPPRG